MHRLETENVCNKITKAADRCDLWVGFILICMLVCISFFFTLLCNRKPVTLFLNIHIREWMRGRQAASWMKRLCLTGSYGVFAAVGDRTGRRVSGKAVQWEGKTVMRRGRKVLIDGKETSAEAQTELRMRPLMVTLWAPAPADLTAWSIVHWWSHPSTFS